MAYGLLLHSQGNVPSGTGKGDLIMESKSRRDVPGFQRLQSEVDRMFLELARSERLAFYGTSVFRPNADVYFDSKQKAVVVKLELPGIDPAKVNLEIEDNLITVSGFRSDERPQDAVYYQMEIRYGRFERTVALPPEVDPTQASAEYHGGYLEIVIPIRPRRTARRIPITPEEQASGEEQR